MNQHQARLLQLFQDRGLTSSGGFTHTTSQQVGALEERAIGGPVTVESEVVEWPLNSQPPLPRHQCPSSAQGSPTTALPRGSSICLTNPATSQLSFTTDDNTVETPAMSRQPTNNPWNPDAWGQPGPRKPFDAGAYGSSKRSKTVRSKSTMPQAQSRPQTNATSTPMPTQIHKAGLGDGLAQPISKVTPEQKAAVKNVHSDNNTPKDSASGSHNNKSAEGQGLPASDSSALHLRLKPVTEAPEAQTSRTRASTPSVTPHWGKAATEPTKAMTRASEPFLVTLSEARASSRADRPSMDHYQQRRLGIKSTTNIMSIAPELRDMTEQYERARMEIQNNSGQRRLQKNRTKFDTTDLATLHQIRGPLGPKKEKHCEAKIQYYHELGESPTNWPKSQSDTELGNASEAFAQSREMIRVQALQEKENKQDRGRDENDQKGCNKGDEEYGTWKQPKLHNSKRNAKWVTPEEVRAKVRKAGSNDFGSAHPDEATPTESSLQAVHNGENGRPVQADPDAAPDPGLAGWDGKPVPAPADWENRPKVHAQKYRPEHGDFSQFLDERFHKQYPESFAALPEAMVMDINLHADGISMGPRSQTVTLRNPSSHFGHSDKVLLEVSQLLHNFPDSQFLTGTTEDEFNFVGPTSAQALEEIGYIETSEMYSQRYMALRTREQQPPQLEQEPIAPPTAVDPIETADQWNKKPQISIYLRPAAKDDLSQLTEIYNWHVENGPRPTEMEVISEDDMRVRLDDATSSKLPLIVAVANFKVKKRNHSSNKFNTYPNSHPVQNANSGYQGIVAKEKIVGWASATDWSASDYVERISAELEVYVDPEHRMSGVGGCLMDKMLQICDRGYIARNACTFSCLPEHTWMYNNGGARDLHKIWFNVRTWSKPVKTPEDQKAFKGFDREDEVDIWVKPWLESMDFVQEGHLRQIGVKNGRFLDLLIFSRITSWQPVDGQIPDPLPGTF